MFSSLDWSFSHKLEDQIRQLQNLKNRGQDSPSMDIATTIITQVARDEESRTNGYVTPLKDNTHRSSIRKKKQKTGGQDATFRSMFCCFGRPKRKNNLNGKPVPDSNWAPVNGRTEHVSPATTPSIVNNNTQDITSMRTSPDGEQRFLLPAKPQNLRHKKCAVIDLDETLVHSSFKPVSNADFTVPVEIEGTVHQVYVSKRPHVDAYLKRMGEMYECVLFTASLAKYADPVADLLDKQGVFTARLFRESCVFHRGNYVKDLSLIGRDLNEVIIIDNSPASYIFHPDNAVPVVSWFDDPHDTELLDLLPFLEAIAKSNDVYSILRSNGFASHAEETTAAMQQQQDLHDDEDDEER